MKLRTIITFSLMMLALLAAGCGGVSAPPVDLPAPITGRVDVSEPNADGNVTITGAEGAVEGGSLVLAVNETVAGEQSVLHLLDGLIPSAHADSDWPATCFETGHACAEADATGAFTMELAAEVGDSIAIGTIDADSGEWTSDVLREEVPMQTEQTSGDDGTDDAVVDDDDGGVVEEEAAHPCADQGVSGAAIDIATLPDDDNQAYALLLQGSETTTNQVVFGSATGLAAALTVDVPGCHAHSIAMHKDAETNLVTIAVTSSVDKTIWRASFPDNSDGAENELTYTYNNMPAHIAFAESVNEAVVAFETSGSVEYGIVSFADGSFDLMASTPGEVQGGGEGTVTKMFSRRLELLTIDNDILGIALTSPGSASESVMTIFSVGYNKRLGTFPVSAFGLVQPYISEISDVGLWVEYDAGAFKVNGVFLGKESTQFETLGTFQVLFGEQEQRLTIDADMSVIDSMTTSGVLDYVQSSGTDGILWRHLAISTMVKVNVNASTPSALVATNAGTLKVFQLGNLDVHDEVTSGQASGSNIHEISVDDVGETVYLLDLTTDSPILVDALVWGV